MPRAKRIPVVLSEVQKLRFLENVIKTPVCWVWSGRTDGFGYGHFKAHGRTVKAHRVAWTLAHGPIPDNKTLDHVCRNPKCVNPAHLELVTNKENILRGTSPTAGNARKDTCIRGHRLDGPRTKKRGNSRECDICSLERCRATRARQKANA